MASGALGSLSGVVLAPAGGSSATPLWSRNADRPMQPGSATKLLTTAATLLSVPATARISTKVVAGDTPDSVVLVGGGDPTLSALPRGPSAGDPSVAADISAAVPTGTESVYPGAAKLDDLAEEVRNAHPGPIRAVYVDLSRFTGAGQAPGWDTADVAGGQWTPIVPLIMDGGRTRPAELDPPRQANPAAEVGQALARRLGADPSTVSRRAAPARGAVLAEVYSPMIGDLVQNALRISDNVLAESLARQVALARGADPSFAGAARAVLDVLGGAGFDTSGVTLRDGSGLSTEDEVPARLLAQILGVAAGPDSDPRAVALRPLVAGLAVAAGDGTLDDRFDTPDSAAGRGYVRAKTGTLTGVSALAGVVTDEDGRLLAFALMSNGTSPTEARPALDALATALRGCGCRGGG
jgi:D-alanyl-D-alanine carboxypeptidase/D-alanyl-D-alanine-endopeptidase (penicillin-binding protein 4)